jgi:glycerol-3-phosphate acyltransferase PlsY
MSSPWLVLAFICGCYLVGGIPFGLLLGQRRGIDLRQHGSRNIGATNAGRVLGRWYGLAVFFLDVAKGLVPMGLLGWLAPFDVAGHNAWHSAAWVVSASACVVGHMYPIYLRFRGGKGVATILGVTLGIYPRFTVAGLVCFGVWTVVTLCSRYSSLGSICAMFAFPITHLLAIRPIMPEQHWPVIVYAFVLPGAVVLQHRENISRLLAGIERRVGKPRE